MAVASVRDQIGDAMGLTFGVLGPLWAEDDRGRLALKGPRHRAVLARLLVARGRVVPVTQLVDDLWEQPPENAIGAIQTFIAALRRVLEPDRAPRQAARVLVSAPPGYAVRIEPEQVDAGRFENAVRRAGELLDASRAAEAVTELDGALALWQGPAYAEFAEFSWARGEIVRLDEMRLLAVESRARALLESGRAAAAVVAMESHLHDHPLREQAWMLFALGLYRGGRQADALAALRTVRGRLRAELGVDPGPELRELEAAILAQAPHLDARRDVGAAGMAAREREAGYAAGRADGAERAPARADSNGSQVVGGAATGGDGGVEDRGNTTDPAEPQVDPGPEVLGSEDSRGGAKGRGPAGCSSGVQESWRGWRARRRRWRVAECGWC